MGPKFGWTLDPVRCELYYVYITKWARERKILTYYNDRIAFLTSSALVKNSYDLAL